MLSNSSVSFLCSVLKASTSALSSLGSAGNRGVIGSRDVETPENPKILPISRFLASKLLSIKESRRGAVACVLSVSFCLK